MRNPNSKCHKCNKEFYARPIDKQKGQGKFCSFLCYKKSRGWIITNYPIKKVCLTCGVDFEIHSTRRRKKKFCSQVCAARFSNRKRRGIKYNGEWNLRRRLIEKFGHKCMISGCNYDKVVDAHHIIEKSKGGTDDVENGILLCPNHHREVHLGMISLDKIKF